MKCVICNNFIDGVGCNAEPLHINGRCCDNCNNLYVIPLRIKQLMKND